MEISNGWLETDQSSWRKLNAKKPAHYHLTKLLQNVLDTDCTRVSIVLVGDRLGSQFRITYDGSYGLPDICWPWSMFPSGRADKSQYRGRQGRALKGLVAVLDNLEIRTPQRSVLIDHDASEVVRSLNVKGSKEVLLSGSSKLWKPSDMAHASEALSSILPPLGKKVTVNGREVPKRQPTRSYTLPLETVECGDSGIEYKSVRKVQVDLIGMGEDEEPTLHEMGIPIEFILMDRHIDIHQRVLLDSKKGTTIPAWRRNLLAKVLMKEISKLEE